MVDSVAGNKQRSSGTARTAGDFALFAIALGSFLWLVGTLEGLNFDTIFLAVYFTFLTIFIVKILISRIISEE